MSDALTAYEEWQELTRQHLSPPDLWEYQREAFLAGFAAGGVAALEQAANDLDGSDKAQVSYRCIATDLHARAAQLRDTE